jgi:hypothetical protein
LAGVLAAHLAARVLVGQLRLIDLRSIACHLQRRTERRCPLVGVLTQLPNVVGMFGAQYFPFGSGILADPLDKLSRLPRA